MLSRASLMLCSIAFVPLSAVESAIPRLVGELLVGTADLEPGVAAEWTFGEELPIRVRPEALINRRDLPGLALSVTFPIAAGSLPGDQELHLGPRLVFHNERYRGGKYDDDLRYGLGFEVFGIYDFPIVPSQPGRHGIQALAALGVVDHRDDLDPSLTVGAAYAFSF